MTSAQLQPSGTGRVIPAVLLLAACAGCHNPSLHPPAALQGPVGETGLWAVAPFANESGVSVVDRLGTADAFTAQLEQVEGIDTVAVNRVIQAMRATGLTMIETPRDAMALIEALDVDALVVGTVTAYDPYPPPTLGMAVQVFTRTGRAAAGPAIDPQALVRAMSGDDDRGFAGPPAAPGQAGPSHAAAQASGMFDARNHQTLEWLAQYAAGRSEPGSALGPDVYLMDMELYTQFVSYRLIRDLLAFGQPQTPERVATRR